MKNNRENNCFFPIIQVRKVKWGLDLFQPPITFSFKSSRFLFLFSWDRMDKELKYVQISSISFIKKSIGINKQNSKTAHHHTPTLSRMARALKHKISQLLAFSLIFYILLSTYSKATKKALVHTASSPIYNSG